MNQNHLVIKHNKLIELQGKSTALEQKLFLSTIARISTEDEDFKEYKINVKELGKTLNMTTKSLYKELDKATDKLATRLIKIERLIENNNKISKLKTTLFSSVEYVEGEGYIKVLVDPKLKPYLIQLSGSFTKYELENIIELKSTYSIRIYELLKQYQTIKKRTFTVDELKKILGIENEYLRFYDFERYVLKVAKKEITKTTDLFVTYRKIKVGRKIGKIEFEIERRYSEKDLQYGDAKMLCEITDFKTRELVENSGLIAFKTNEKQFMDLYSIACEMTDKFSLDPCQYIKINYEYMKEKNDIANPVAYLKTILKNDGAGARIKMLGL